MTASTTGERSHILTVHRWVLANASGVLLAALLVVVVSILMVSFLLKPYVSISYDRGFGLGVSVRASVAEKFHSVYPPFAQ